MEHRPQIAVITRNALMNIGLKSILERIIPMAEVRTFTAVGELEAEGDTFFHYFVSSQTFIEHSRFFLGRRHRTIVLTESGAVPQPTAGVSYLNINCSDVDLCEYQGKTHIFYGNGDQMTYSFLCEAVYDGPLDEFLEAFFR